MFDFRYGPRLRVGAGAAVGIDSLLPPGPVLVVSDAGLTALGLVDPLLRALRAAGRVVTLFDAVEADPSAATVLRCVAAGQGVAAVVGFGGGSPMDVAKLAAYLLGSGDLLDDIYGVDQAQGRRLPLVLVPTTAGTGSEATPISIITVGETEKKGVVSAPLVPDWAVLDATLTLGLPRAVTAATGIDAMVHAIEAYTSKRLKNPMSDMLARAALRLLAANIRRACDVPGDIEARQAMLMGSHLAGVAFANAPVGGVHALAYPLGGHFHVPHGLSNALMLPGVLRFNLPEAADFYAELSFELDAAGADVAKVNGAEGFIAALQRIAVDCGLPDRLSAVGVAESDLDLLAAEAMKQQRLLINNPRVIGEGDARRLYAEVL
ncbi:iron-containing alcohol dehydrogenase [Sandaracinobacteroides saxicola]|uniref:Alcohol dehydrogenase 2 n=1 Tax=Sandaracinobacteroides saxicola TaxID=2759707 RepID=A0A7G5IIK7_9SPHN|nr:iron-containing alcohol dehydrogenase [Sandaracinobacteroides saxicola]QMW23199.1 iron-containing alcohol dehydrogenase [Sandaracinobacteroides saxicola]